MNIEARDHSFLCPEVITALKQRLSENETTHVAFDLDGTLLDATKVFTEARLAALEILDPKEGPPLADQFLDAIIALRPEFHVNPAVMHVSLVNCAMYLGLSQNDPKIATARDRIDQIYNGRDRYPIFPEAKETIIAFFQAGVEPILVSHGADDYTKMKIQQADLSHLFAHIANLNINRPKNEQWEGVFNRLGIDPRQVLVVGDNLAADIEPALILRAEAVWINKKASPSQCLSYGNGQADRLSVIRSIDQLIPALTKSTPLRVR